VVASRRIPPVACTPRLDVRSRMLLDTMIDDEFEVHVTRLAAELRKPTDS
jgi:hypothetical protein